METIVGLFERYEDADRLVHDLAERGFAQEQISIVVREYIVQRHRNGTAGLRGTVVAEGAAGGALLGGFMGLLLGVTALAIPGIGPAITGGALATVLGATAAGAGLGAAGGGLLGALMGLGIPEEQAHFYAEGVKRGGVLVLVESDEGRIEEVRQAMVRENVADLERLRMNWQNENWHQFDESTEPNEQYPTFLA